MSPNPGVRDAMLAQVPSLRAYAISLCRGADRADDLVQETLMRAWAHIDSFEAGTNMAAWLFTILRNAFNSEYRKLRHEVADGEGTYAATLKSLPEQNSRMQFDELRAALRRLPIDQSEALVLIGALGFSYEEVAEICGCAVGTIKSRVNRARRKLAEIMSIESTNDFGASSAQRAVLEKSEVVDVASRKGEQFLRIRSAEQ